MTCLFTYSKLPSPITLSLHSSKTHVRWIHTVTLQLHTLKRKYIIEAHSHTALTHPKSSRVLVPTSPKTASMLIKIAQWPALWWKSGLLLSHICLGGSHKDGPWCVRLEMLFHAVCGPHHYGDTRQTDRDTRTTFSRTHMYLMTLCVIFGAQPSYRQITSSSVSLAWMCSREAARDDAILLDCSII